jgi:hypothetical protein
MSQTHARIHENPTRRRVTRQLDKIMKPGELSMPIQTSKHCGVLKLSSLLMASPDARRSTTQRLKMDRVSGCSLEGTQCLSTGHDTHTTCVHFQSIHSASSELCNIFTIHFTIFKSQPGTVPHRYIAHSRPCWIS